MANYLVTGCAGFIGATVSRFLLAGGHTVVGIDNLNNAYDVRLKEWRLAHLREQSHFEFHRLDICDRQGLIDLFSQFVSQTPPFDAIINLAARAGVRQSIENPWLYFETNTTGTLNLLELARQHSIPKFVLASTSSLYGQNTAMPYREDADTDHPLSPYAASKKAAEVLCHTYHYLYGIDVTILRYFTVYGPAGRPDMMPFRMVQWISEGRPVKIFGDGQQSRDFTYVDDIARGTIDGLRMLGYQIINLGSDTPVVLMDVLHMVEDLVGKEACLEFKARHAVDMPATWADISKAKMLLGWHPQVTIREGLKRLVEWYHVNDSWTQDVPTE